MTTRIINVKLFVHRNYIFAFEGGPEKEGYLSSFGKGRTIGGTFVGSILVEEKNDKPPKNYNWSDFAYLVDFGSHDKVEIVLTSTDTTPFTFYADQYAENKSSEACRIELTTAFDGRLPPICPISTKLNNPRLDPVNADARIGDSLSFTFSKQKNSQPALWRVTVYCKYQNDAHPDDPNQGKIFAWDPVFAIPAPGGR